MNRIIVYIFTAVGLMCGAIQVYAIPSLQLGPDGNTGWAYDGATETWVLNGSGGVNAYANATTGNGAYAWNTTGITQTQLAYLVISGVPDLGNMDTFNVTVENDGETLALYDSGFGDPPLEDLGGFGIAPHGIFDTWFEIYKFNFDVADGVVNINDTQPGGTGTGDGFVEHFNITLNSSHIALDSIHFDLFTVKGEAPYELGALTKDLVNAVAPFSHDAEMTVPEPTSLVLMGLGLVGLGFFTRKNKSI